MKSIAVVFGIVTCLIISCGGCRKDNGHIKPGPKDPPQEVSTNAPGKTTSTTGPFIE